MLAFTFISLAAVATASVIQLGIEQNSPSTKKSDIPELPSGFFYDVNHVNGSNTLTFVNTDESFSFMPWNPAPTYVPKPNPTKTLLERSQPSEKAPVGHSDCWNFGELNHSGVDQGINDFRAELEDSDLGLGIPDGYSYFGYNEGGVFVSFCTNTNDSGYTDFFCTVDLNFATYWRDQDCGAYQPGYYEWDSPSLFGKCQSGTPVCLGS
jgi:hypothetical protein